jgi:hypothetical protein
MNMGMEAQLLRRGMEYTDDAGHCARIFIILCKAEQRLGRCINEQL